MFSLRESESGALCNSFHAVNGMPANAPANFNVEFALSAAPSSEPPSFNLNVGEAELKRFLQLRAMPRVAGPRAVVVRNLRN